MPKTQAEPLHRDDQRAVEHFKRLSATPELPLGEGGLFAPTDHTDTGELVPMAAIEYAQAIGHDLMCIDVANNTIDGLDYKLSPEQMIFLQRFANALDFDAGQLSEAAVEIRRYSEWIYAESVTPDLRAVSA